MLNIKSKKGYSLLEIGVGLVIIVIFMYYSITMLKATYSTYRYIEQNNMIMTYLIKSVENELLDDVEINIASANSVVQENSLQRKVIVTTIPSTNELVKTSTKITTIVESLPAKNGKDYTDSPVKLVKSVAEYYTRTNDESSKRTMTLQTLKIGGKELGT